MTDNQPAHKATSDGVAELEKAYGGCHNCYGKGYATYRSAYSSYGTDGDIGGFEGRYYQPYEKILFCKCDRGKQLEAIITQECTKARLRGYNSGWVKAQRLSAKSSTLNYYASQLDIISKTLREAASQLTAPPQPPTQAQAQVQGREGEE